MDFFFKTEFLIVKIDGLQFSDKMPEFKLVSIFVCADKDENEEGEEIDTFQGQVMIKVPPKKYSEDEEESLVEETDQYLKDEYKELYTDCSLSTSESDKQGFRYMVFDLTGDEFIKGLLKSIEGVVDDVITDDNDKFWKPIWDEQKASGKLGKLLSQMGEMEKKILPLIEKANPNVFNKNGDTLLHFTSKWNAFVGPLLDNGADPELLNYDDKTYKDIPLREVWDE